MSSVSDRKSHKTKIKRVKERTRVRKRNKRNSGKQKVKTLKDIIKSMMAYKENKKNTEKNRMLRLSKKPISSRELENIEKLYHRFKTYKMKPDEFINMDTPSSIRTVKDFKGFKQKGVEWNQLQCKKEKNITPNLKVKSMCKADDTLEQVFVQMSDKRLPVLRSLRDYVRGIQNGYITHSDHTKLFKYLFEQESRLERKMHYDMMWYNHNLDIPILNFKIGYSGQDF